MFLVDSQSFLRRHLVENLLNQKLINSSDDCVEISWNQVSRDVLQWFRVVLKPAAELTSLVGLCQTVSDVVCEESR